MSKVVIRPPWVTVSSVAPRTSSRLSPFSSTAAMRLPSKATSAPSPSRKARKGTMVHPDAARGAVPPKSRYAPFRLTLMPSG